MLPNDELSLLIKSKYPVVFVESIDEEYVVNQLRQIASQLDLIFYQWSVTAGLQRGFKEGPYYQTGDPEKMIKNVLSLIKTDRSESGIFVLKDFDKYLENSVILRLFKDLVNLIKNTKNTIVIIGPEYKLPKDIEPEAAHIVGGYPDEKEIAFVLKETFNDLIKNEKGRVSLTVNEIQKIVKSLKGLSVQQIRNVIHQSFIDDHLIDIRDLNTIESYKKRIFDQEGLLEFCITEDKENVANFDNLKRWLNERKESFQRETPSLSPPRGVLLMGVQGCGKSLAVKAVAKELGLPLYRLDIGRLYSQYIGQTEQNLRKALAIVDKLSPLCLWIDEIEKGFAASAGESDGGVSQRVLGSFLTWMQERRSNCFLAATANDIYHLPPEFLRKGRFDEIFFVDLPDQEIRTSLFAIHLRKRGLNPEKFDCKLLAEKAADFSGAEIEQAIISALYRASSKKEPISTNHILEQIRSTKPLALLKQEEITFLREWAKERTIPA
jgi:ATPase family associated with various cellular activities (AAA)